MLVMEQFFQRFYADGRSEYLLWLDEINYFGQTAGMIHFGMVGNNIFYFGRLNDGFNTGKHFIFERRLDRIY